MTKHLLILTQYFPPEVGAPQNRLFELAIRLKRLGIKVSVFTAMPNYPKMEIHPEYKGKKYLFEAISSLDVHRCYIYVSKSKGIINRLLNYFSFVLSSAYYAPKKIEKVDFILCESPPLFLGYSALFLKRKFNAKLIFNVSDLWPESAEKLGVVQNKLLLNLAYRLEAKLYQKSALVTGQTQGICSNIKLRFPQVKTYWLPNSVDLNYYNPQKIGHSDFRTKHGFSKSDFICLYAGIIGLAQGLDIILDAANKLTKDTHLKFVLLGSGPEKDRLMQKKKNQQITNVHFIESISKEEMPFVLKSINASIIPLRKLDLFKGAIPSKIFECLAMKIPILLGVDGEARKLFIDEGNAGLYFEPENVEQLIQGIQKLSTNNDLYLKLGENGREYVNTHFNRDQVCLEFYNELITLH